MCMCVNVENKYAHIKNEKKNSLLLQQRWIEQTSEQILQTYFNLTLGDRDAFAIQ